MELDFNDLAPKEALPPVVTKPEASESNRVVVVIDDMGGGDGEVERGIRVRVFINEWLHDDFGRRGSDQRDFKEREFNALGLKGCGPDQRTCSSNNESSSI
ncbi:hypothetical protein Scep_009985 [Stephania cephalantha]|uniref:Uncharacterized protein n=1 Tax=Stephania cephalantha TaxID=152367 RepID=A0AAP0PET7_9MAGN